uniref:Uncharacterized protein n=1 Tax=viral metagenome TaxID=1070528 RepID=A0A6C0ACL9_9ZZZZ
MNFFILLFILSFLTCFSLEIKENYKQLPKSENTWYIINQNYCKQHCDKKISC